MRLSEFETYISSSERADLDFKLECMAFNPVVSATVSEKLKAELAKDICAMANNRILSRIIIGVSDDRTVYKSVENQHLTEENLQAFCRKAIFPPPTVSLTRVSWPDGLKEIAGKVFVVIEIGPHRSKVVFRLNQDFIGYEQKFCFKRHEVWIRRGPTSDLATPEEIAWRLLGGKKSKDDIDPWLRAHRSDFASASEAERLKSLRETARKVVAANGYVQAGEVSPAVGTKDSVVDHYLSTFTRFIRLDNSSATLILLSPPYSRMTLRAFSGFWDVAGSSQAVLHKRDLSRACTALLLKSLCSSHGAKGISK